MAKRKKKTTVKDTLESVNELNSLDVVNESEQVEDMEQHGVEELNVNELEVHEMPLVDDVVLDNELTSEPVVESVEASEPEISKKYDVSEPVLEPTTESTPEIVVEVVEKVEELKKEVTISKPVEVSPSKPKNDKLDDRISKLSATALKFYRRTGIIREE